MKRLQLALAVGLIFMGLIFFADSAVAAPWISARAYSVFALETGQLLEGKNVTASLPPASTTKIMTALLSLDYLDLDEKAVVSQRAERTPPTSIGLRAGQEIKVRDLLIASLLTSANDATVVLAERMAGSEEIFSYLMTKKAVVLGATSTDFKNSNGLPAKGHLSSCRDLFLISREALRRPFFAETVARTEAVIQHPGYPQGKLIRNTNRLLTSYPGVKGIKTGTTDAAGKCLVSLASRQDRHLITVVLRAGDRYRDSIAMLDYAFTSFQLQKVIDHNQVYKSLRVDNGDLAKVAVYPAHDVTLWLPEEGLRHVEKRVILDYRPRAPIKKGDRIGTLEVYYKGELAGETGLVAGASVEKMPRGIWKLVKRAVDLRPGSV